MLIGVGALVVGMQHRTTSGRAATPAGISPLDSGPITSFDTPGLFGDPEAGTPEDVEPSVVRVQGAQDGTGVVVDERGIVLTSAEVAGNLPNVTVTFADRTTATGTRLGTDPVTNLAVIDLPGNGYEAARLLGPSDLDDGDAVVCAGVDDDGFRTVAGTVAATRAPLRVEGGTLDGMVRITPDSGPSPQRLGCAVVDASGAVLAVTTALDDTAYYATPVEAASKVASDVLATGRAHHVWLGLLSSDTDDEPGVLLADLDPDGPAAEVLQAGDVITSVDGTPVPNMSTVVGILQTRSPGDELAIEFERDGEAREVTITLAPLPRARR
ncbi:MAG TPA: S1C family serine protease [Acidimicrobiales bacterium]